MFVKKIIFVVGIILFFSSCEMFTDNWYDNKARIKFEWDYDYDGIFYYYKPPVRFFDTNPAIPNRPQNDIYYPTEAGQYYLEYVLTTNNAYYMIYTIEIWKNDYKETDGGGNGTTWINGELIKEKDNYKEFEISLYDGRPPGWSDQYYAYDVQIEPIRGEIPSRSVIPPGSNVGPLLYKITQKKDGASMIIEFGVLNNDE